MKRAIYWYMLSCVNWLYMVILGRFVVFGGVVKKFDHRSKNLTIR